MSLLSFVPLYFYALLLLCPYYVNAERDINMVVQQVVDIRRAMDPLRISSTWQIIGPFQLGTRGMTEPPPPLRVLESRADNSCRGFMGRRPSRVLWGIQESTIRPQGYFSVFTSSQWRS